MAGRAAQKQKDHKLTGRSTSIAVYAVVHLLVLTYILGDQPFARDYSLSPSSRPRPKANVAFSTASGQRAAVSLEGAPCLEVGGGVTTAVNFRIMPSDLLKT